MSNRVVITGIGAITPIGNSLNDIEFNLYNGNSNFTFREDLNAVVGQVHYSDQLDHFDKNITDKCTRLAYSAYKNATKNLNTIPEGIFLGAAYGSLHSTEETLLDYYNNKKNKPSALIRCMPNNACSFIALKEKIKGPAVTISTACSSSSVAIGEAYLKIKNGDYSCLVAGGAESNLVKPFISSWLAIGAISKEKDNLSRACRPFANDRNGTVISEGAVFYVLESLESALKRDAIIYGEIVDYSVSCGSESMTKPDEESQIMAFRKIKKKFIKEDIYINAHATGTVQGDMVELESIKKVFKNKNVYVSSTKSIHGHLLGAAGAMELLSCLIVLKNQKIIPNYFLDDIKLLNKINVCLPIKEIVTKIDLCLNTSFAFGGTNTILAVSRVDL